MGAARFQARGVTTASDSIGMSATDAAKGKCGSRTPEAAFGNSSRKQGPHTTAQGRSRSPLSLHTPLWNSPLWTSGTWT
eukprot:364639-Chlamydomonas_euryale.AAC.52